MWLVGGDRASGCVFEGGLVAVAAGVDVVVVEEFVVAGAEQDEVVEFGRAAVLDGGEVVCFEFAGWRCSRGIGSALSVCAGRVAAGRWRSVRCVSGRGRGPAA